MALGYPRGAEFGTEKVSVSPSQSAGNDSSLSSSSHSQVPVREERAELGFGAFAASGVPGGGEELEEEEAELVSRGFS